MARCKSTYPGAVTLRGRAVRCELAAGHTGEHGHSFAARYWIDPGTIRLGQTPGGRAYRIVAADGRDMLVQTDWDYPGVAQSFGWSLTMADNLARNTPDCPAGHSGTDGTIACPDCGMSASAFINDAAAWLDDNMGAVTADPGYFDGAA